MPFTKVSNTVKNNSQPVHMTDTTQSTSTSTGTLVADGGAAFKKNVYVGESLNVAGAASFFLYPPIKICTANTSTSYTIDLANGNSFYLTLTNNVTFTFPATGTAGYMQQFWIVLVRDATPNRIVTWDTDVKWPQDVLPILDGTASKMSIFRFFQMGNSSRWYGEILGLGYTI